MGDELLLDFHQLVQVAEGHFRFDHPELGQVAAGLGFLGPESRPEAIDFAKSHDIGFVVELAGLGEVGLALVEIFRLEEGGCPFHRRRGQDGCIHVDEAILLEPLTNGRDDRGAHAQDGPLAGHADPQMAVVEGKIHALFFERHRVVFAGQLDDFDILDANLVATRDAGGALVFPHRTGDDHRGFLRQAGELVENSFGQVAFESHALHETGTIPHEQENQLAFIGAVVDPALDGDFLAGIFGDFFYADNWGHDSLLVGLIIAQAELD